MGFTWTGQGRYMASHTANVAQLIPAKERADLCTFELHESIDKKVTLSCEKRRMASPPGSEQVGQSARPAMLPLACVLCAHAGQDAVPPCQPNKQAI